MIKAKNEEGLLVQFTFSEFNYVREAVKHAKDDYEFNILVNQTRVNELNKVLDSWELAKCTQ